MQQKKQSCFGGQSIPKDSSVNIILLQITIESEGFYILSLIYHKSGLTVVEAHCLPLCLTFTGLCKVLSQPIYLLLEHIISLCLTFISLCKVLSVCLTFIGLCKVLYLCFTLIGLCKVLLIYVFVSHIPWPVQSSISLSLTFIGLCKVLYDSVSYICWPVQSFYLSLCLMFIGLSNVLSDSVSYIRWPVQCSV